jgi:hypothetical protein
MQELTNFMREFLDYYFAQVHTSLPGVVTEYDASKRRATVQPSLKRRAGNKEYIAFPLLIDVPVLFPGTKKWTIHFPLEKDDEVAVFFSERALEAWKDVGQDGIEDPDPRRYDLCDAYCMPGLQPREFIAAEEAGLQIIHKDKFDGELISQVLMTDELIEAIYKEKAQILMKDDYILGKTEKCLLELSGDKAQAKTEKCSLEMSGDKIVAKNSKNTLELNDAVSLVTSGSGLVELGNAIGTIGGVLDSMLTSLENLATEGSPAAHTAKTWATANILIFSFEYTLFSHSNSLYYKELANDGYVVSYEKNSNSAENKKRQDIQEIGGRRKWH